MEGLFNKIIRVVNQLSRTAGKKIKIETEGATTEIDRKLINEIYDPLVHIVRNAVDHGIETESERIKKKKDPIGKITIEAKHEGNEIWISVMDDGTGLNKQGIIGKALKKGLINSRELNNISDENLYKFIFEPGFSTAANVSEISGRGVGMDVVKKNIEKLRGDVEIKTEKEKGTKIILKIPVTLEIMRAMLVKVGTNKYSIPVTDVIETISTEGLKFFTTEGNKKAVKLRDEIIPTVLLDEVFKKDKEKARLNRTSHLAVIVSKNKKKMCIIIDEVLGTQQIVIKSLPKYMGHLKNVSGCSIIGSGEISLILDTGSIINNLLE
jgi:two-component system chemotaxis sensor kinase CheA